MVATDRDAEKLGGLATAGLETHALDVLDDAAVARAVAAAGPLDVLFNCAGFVHQNTALTCTDAEWDFAFALNVRSMWKVLQAALPGMLERRRGSIINMASAAGSIKGAPNRFVYGTTKARRHRHDAGRGGRCRGPGGALQLPGAWHSGHAQPA